MIPDTGPGRPADTGLEQFLVERYALYSMWHGHLVRGTLSHQPWTVRPAQLTYVCGETITAAGFTVSGSPHLLVGDHVDVTVHPLSRVLEATQTSIVAGSDTRRGFEHRRITSTGR